MPRGVAIPEVRQQLFAVVEQVVVRDGPGKLSGRAITGEAGVATGLLYAHFTDFDGFLAAYAVDRSFLISAAAAALPERAGTGSVSGNVADALLSTPPTTLLALTRLIVARPQLPDLVRAVLGDRTAGLEAVENAAGAYLAEEQRLGRLTAGADPGALALAAVGVLQRITLDAATDTEARVRATVTALLDPVTTATPLG
ncbi:TetR/AcrR family transcriptional regulator [Amycolatopsis sp. 195334CR]|uniref:TetR/AcrR family transcriptional regulator n=1 Tax=Amycolatopsis sp. 195334CR TaxID=2814588 RepID=UPI001A8E5BB1|nr:TetR/AcrR family transcriptional regulator [Amycolatopsis sp. 195334CR]MBN6038135.1 TetR/AcrR family transcriptional regulator [Amycolatopsis sp. 195334CR]